jgi:hypothetical protein
MFGNAEDAANGTTARKTSTNFSEEREPGEPVAHLMK